MKKQQKKEDLPQVKKMWVTRTMVVPIVIGGYIVARGTGMNMFIRGLMFLRTFLHKHLYKQLLRVIPVFLSLRSGILILILMEMD